MAELSLTKYTYRPKIYTPEDALFYSTYGDWPSSLWSLIPTMTSTTAPSGEVSTSSAYGSDATIKAYAPFVPLSDTTLNGWVTNAGGCPAWIQYKFPQPMQVLKYWIIPWNFDAYPARVLTSWKFQGSTDGSTWVDLDTRSAPDPATQATTSRNIFVLSGPVLYQYYRLYILANYGTNA